MMPPPATPIGVVVVGPDPTDIGGMAGVVGQMLALPFGETIRVRYFPLPPRGEKSESVFSRVRRHLRHLIRWRRELESNPVSIAHIHTCSGFSFWRSAMDAWVARRSGAKVVLHIHGARFDEFCRESGWVARRMMRRILTSADRVIVLSQHWKEVLLKTAPRAQLAVIPNAIELPSRNRQKRREGRCRFMLLAKMDEWKGIDDLLLACGSLAHSDVPFELILAGPAGSAGDATVLNRKIADLALSDRIVYAGPVAGDQKEELLRWADVYVQPSHHEGLPLSVLEAMSFALPVITTTVGALPEVIEDGVHGRLVSPGRPDLLAKAMSDLANPPTLRAEMGARSRRRVEERFSLGRFRDDLAALYAGLVSRTISAQSKSSPPDRSLLGRVPPPLAKGEVAPSVPATA